ncbi:MAG TPA: response regulator [Alphaproteobacteria bacterium]|nr:response regulator [Alphaproteobacteria bacterium]
MATALIVDDDRTSRDIIQGYLESAGHRIATAVTGRDASRLLAARHEFEVIVTDIFMPDMDGLEFIRTVKASHPHARIIAVSGGGMRVEMDFLHAAKKFGADAVLQKPFTRSALLELVDKAPQER